MTAQNSGSMEEIEFHPDAVSVSEYSWYSHPRCSWVREFDELIQTFKKDQGLKCISIDNLMGLVLLNMHLAPGQHIQQGHKGYDHFQLAGVWRK